MAKMFKKVNGVWKPLTLSKNIDGTFKKIKKVFRKIDGVWRPIHSGVVEFTFASSITATTPTGILLSDYIDPNSADEFVITVNSGVTLSGMTGTTGAAGYNNTNCATLSNCPAFFLLNTFFFSSGISLEFFRPERPSKSKPIKELKWKLIAALTM